MRVSRGKKIGDIISTAWLKDVDRRYLFGHTYVAANFKHITFDIRIYLMCIKLFFFLDSQGVALPFLHIFFLDVTFRITSNFYQTCSQGQVLHTISGNSRPLGVLSNSLANPIIFIALSRSIKQVANLNVLQNTFSQLHLPSHVIVV